MNHSPSASIDAVVQPTRQRMILLVCLFIGIFVAYLDRVNVSVLAASDIFLTDMGIKGKPFQIGMMMSVFLAAYGIANVTLAPLGDYLGPRKAMLLCIVLWTVSLFIGSIATAFSIIIVSRVILGIGEGAYYPLQSLFVKNWFPTKERGRANAAWIIGQSVAPAVAMPLFVYIIGSYGWRESFHMCLVLGLVPLYMLWRHTADTPRQHRKINQAELRYIEEGQAEERAKASEISSEKPTLMERIRPFATNYCFWLLVVWYLCLQCLYWGLISWLPAYLKSARGFTWAEMGWIASLPFILGIFFKAMSGWLADRVGRSAPILTASMLLAGICIYLGTTLPDKYASAIALSFAAGLCTMGTPAAWTLLQGLVPSKSTSTASGFMNGIANGLSSLSPALIGLFISITGRYEGGLLCLIVTSVVATIVGGILVAKKY